MRKKFLMNVLKSTQKISVSGFLLLYTFTPSALAISDISAYADDSSVEIDESENIANEGVSDPAQIAKGVDIVNNKEDEDGNDIAVVESKTKNETENILTSSAPRAPTVAELKSTSVLLSDTGQYTISSTSGTWSSVVCTGSNCNLSGVGTNEIKWGSPATWGGDKSGLLFTSQSESQSFNAGQTFLIGTLTHQNWPVTGDTAKNATLNVSLDFSNPELVTNPQFSYQFNIKETSNGYSSYKNCPGFPSEQNSTTPCDDVITFPNAYGENSFTIGDIKYTLKIDGFQSQYQNGTAVQKFITEEEKNNVAYLVGHLSTQLVERPAVSIIKKVNGEDANTEPGIYIGQGDPVAFEYVVQNTGNVRLTNITVTDDKGVNVSCPEAALEPGTNMTCTSTGTHTATLGLYTNIGKVVGTHLGGTVTDTDPANYTGLKKIKICHATSAHDNPYNNANASMDGDVQGHDSHHGNNPPRIWYRGIVGSWDDIIPPFNYNGVNYPGKNWDGYGQSVYNNDCTIPQGTLKVNKVTIPSTDTTSFNITGTGTPAASGAPTFHNGNTGTISHGNPHTYTVSPGTYSVSETVPTGWKEVSNTCNNIVIAKGETKECTITNTKYGSLTIIKNASPSSDQVFSFTTTGTGLSDFTLVDNSDGSNPSKVFTDLLPGTYSVTEDNASGWDLTSATCSDVSPVSAINLSAGENVTCTFVNVKRGSISGHKYYDEDGKAETTNDRHPVQGWTIFIDANNNGVLDDGEASKITGADGKYTFSNIKPGTYKIVEVMKVGWVKLTGLTQTITIVAGENRENVDFVNIEYPTIQVIKKVDTNGDGTVDQENATDWEWKLDGTTYQTGIAPVSKMPGTYSLSETQKTNYHVKSLVCKNGETEIVNEVSESASITLKSGDKVVCTFTNARNLGQLIVKKVVVNDNGGNLEAKDFSFQIDGGTPIQFEEDGQNEYTKYAGLSYNIVEVEADQRGYTTTYDNCSSVTVPHNGTATCIITNTAKAPTLKLVKSVTNDNGGTLTPADWTLTAQNGEDVFNNLGNADTVHTVKAGVGYVLSESEKSGYLPEDWSCDGGTLSSNTITLGLAENVTCTITNNDVAPKLTLNKIVSNTHGGNNVESDWTLKATSGTEVLSGSGASGDADVVSGATFKAGTYTLSEEGPSGYDASAWTCTGTGTQSGSTITLGIGQEAVCSITNSDRASGLTVKKHVKNDNGGTAKADDFGIKLNNNSISFGAGQDAGEEVTTYTSTPSVSSNVEYTLSEIDHSGYDEGTWSCTDNSDGSSVSMPFTLAEGQSVTCEITNDDIAPKLTLNKIVSNTHGGNNVESDWTLTATSGTEVLSGLGAAGDADVVSGSTFKAGTYTLSEEGPSGYDASAWTCTGTGTQSGNSITLGVGEEAVCSITNSDKSQDITIIKKVINDNGGNATVDDFNITLTDTTLTFGTGVVDGTTTTYTTTVSGKSNKEYTLSEVVAGTGYTKDSLSCTVGTDGIFTLTEGQNVTCTIVNNDIAPGLTIKKHVKNDNGGTATVADFGITLTDTALTFDGGVTSGTTTTYTSNPTVVSNKAYTLSEIDHSGYAEGTWSCTDNSTNTSVSMPFTLSEGQSVTCEITNDDIAPSLELVKVVKNDFGGNAVKTDWNLKAEGVSSINGNGGVKSGSDFQAGAYTLSEAGVEGKDVSGYSASDWSCTNGVTVDGSNGITIGIGKSTVCTITNSDIRPGLTVKKHVKNDNGGIATVADFGITLTDTALTFDGGVTNGTTTTYTSNPTVVSNKAYTVSEGDHLGYAEGGWSCIDNNNPSTEISNTFTLSEGQSITCEVTNDDIAPGLTIKKHVKNDNGGTATVGDFGITLTDTDLTFDEGVTNGTTTTYTSNPTVVSNKTYTVTEGDHAGYDEGTWSCTDNSDGSSVSIPFTLSEGQSVTCEVTNDDIQPKLKVVKVVKNGTYGNKNVSDFNLYVSGTSVTSGDTNGFNAGNYTVSEDNLAGYTAVITGDCASDGKVTLTAGDNKTCKITNTSTHGKIIIKKVVEPNTDSTTFKFTGDVEGTIGHNGEISKIVIPGTYSVSETVPEGWNLRDLTCEDPTQDSAQDSTDKNKVNINVSNNETVTCTFTNEKLGKISGYKYEDKNGNGNWDDGEIALSGWTINNGLGGTTTTNASGYYEFTNLPVGDTYTVREVNLLGWKQTSTNPSAITIVAGMDKQNVNFGNFKNVTINVTKDVVGIDGVTDVADSTEFESLLNDADAKTIAERTTATYTVEDPGEYSVTESVNTDYDYIGCFLGDNEFSNYSVESGQTYNVVCKNKQKPATLIVNKSVIDSENNDEGVFSEDEFDVVLGEETKQIADKEGGKVKAEFGGLQPGDYTFTETPKDGYIFDGCTNDGKVTLGSNKTVEVTCTNRIIDPILKIEKSNNKTGIDQYAGKDEVTYTIKVTAPKDESEGTYVLNNVVVSDIAPAGFKYISGTWTAKKNGTDIVIPEPTYNGTEKAQWLLGSMKEGDEIVVTYRTKISNTQDAGLYPDIAWVVGDSLSGGSVLGASTSDPATPFVGTEVKVIEDDIVEKGEVLGASISLPNTGANTYLTLGALIMMIIGAISLLFKPFKKFKYALLSALIAISFVTLITPNTVLAADSDIQVKIMKPETPTNKKSFNVGFVVLDLSNNPVTVECFKDAEVEPFETHTPANAGNCAVTIAASGTYTFYVKATSASGTKKTAPVTVEVNLDKPSPVIDYSKAGNVLKFKTANDGKTVKVEIHRSEKSSYTANASTKIHEMVVAPNTEYTWTDATAEPGKTYYYALRSLDAFGNVSPIVSDEKVVTVLAKEGTTQTTQGQTLTTALEVQGEESVAGVTSESEAEVDSSVKGDMDVADTSNESKTNEQESNEDTTESKEEETSDAEESSSSYANKWYLWVGGLLIVAVVGYLYARKHQQAQ